MLVLVSVYVYARRAFQIFLGLDRRHEADPYDSTDRRREAHESVFSL
jgi:hypothetical protein